MNRRNKPVAKKLEFEPKIPLDFVNESEIKQEEQKEIKIPSNDQQQSMKGVFAPRTFAISKQIKIDDTNFIFNLPDYFQNECSLLIFDDNTFGIKMNGKIYECDGLSLGDSMVVDLDEKAKKVGTPDFILTAYSYEKESTKP